MAFLQEAFFDKAYNHPQKSISKIKMLVNIDVNFCEFLNNI